MARGEHHRATARSTEGGASSPSNHCPRQWRISQNPRSRSLITPRPENGKRQFRSRRKIVPQGAVGSRGQGDHKILWWRRLNMNGSKGPTPFIVDAGSVLRLHTWESLTMPRLGGKGRVRSGGHLTGKDFANAVPAPFAYRVSGNCAASAVPPVANSSAPRNREGARQVAGDERKIPIAPPSGRSIPW